MHFWTLCVPCMTGAPSLSLVCFRGPIFPKHPLSGALGLGGASRLTGVLVLQRAEFRDLVWTVWTTLLRSRQLYLDSLFWSKWSS